MSSPPFLRSAPALGAAIRCTDRRRLPVSTAQLLQAARLPAVYRIETGDREKEIGAAIHTVATVTDKLRRLTGAYGEWAVFDAPAYFDLHPEQAALLVHIVERVSTVHVTFYADLLLPSFRRAEQTWATEFFPGYQAAYPVRIRADQRTSYADHFFEIDAPKLAAYWQRLVDVIHGARRTLSEDIGFLAAAGGSEERSRWLPCWARPAAEGLDERLRPELDAIPTLTLSMNFPLPAHRQPGRLRRLRRMWRRGDWRPRRG